MDMQKILAHPTVAHLMRMAARFTNRLGMQFAGAVTYFSVLAMVPILMFAFAIAGMTLTEFRPDMLDSLKESVLGLISGAPGEVTDTISGIIDDALNNWAGIGVLGLIGLAYAGSGWIKNLKSAIRAQFRPMFDEAENKSNIVVETLKNIGTLILMLLAVGVTFGIASAATAMTGTIIGWLGLEDVTGIGVITRILSFLVSLLAGWLLFLFLYRVMPENRPPTRALLIGALIGSVILAVLQYFAGALVGSFLNNPAAALFGPIIVLLLFFNLFARIILMVGAWIATDNQPAVAYKWNDADEPLLNRDDVVTADDHWPAAEEDRRVQRIEKADAKLSRTETVNKVKETVPGLSADPEAEKEAMDEAIETRLDVATEEREEKAADRARVEEKVRAEARARYLSADGQTFFDDEEEPVARSVALQNARASMTAGYVSGIAAGTGIGAVLAALVGLVTRRQRR